MLLSELLDCLAKLPFKNHFCGIFAANTIPRHLKNGHFMIINTDESTGKGKHWYAIVRLNNLIECFDSLGIANPDKKEFITKHFKSRGINSFTFNTTQLQPSMSVVCGQYVLYYLFERYFNIDMNFDDLLNEIFSENLESNEMVVQKFVTDFL